MSFKLHSLSVAFAAACCAAAPAHAIKINDEAFVANGGDLADIAGTAANVFDQLRNASLAPRFASVGRLGACTATWLGIEGRYAWLLTAASCLPDTGLVARIPDRLVFYGTHGEFVAGFKPDDAMRFVHPKRLARPAGVDDIGTDIALVRISRDTMTSREPDLAPVIHDGEGEGGLPVAFVAHGVPQVNDTPVGAAWTGGTNRRTWGESVLDGTTEQGHAVFANYAPDDGLRWAAVGPSDAGSAWWQPHAGEWRIVATTSTGTPLRSHGTRVAEYATWINDLFPGARLASEPGASLAGVELTNSGVFRSADFHRQTYFVKSPGQPGVNAPTRWMSDPVSTATLRIDVPVTHEASGATSHVVVRAMREAVGCHPREMYEMHNVLKCGTASRMHLTIEEDRNQHLADGMWRGRVDFDAMGVGDSVLHTVAVDIAYSGASPAGTFDFTTNDLATITSSVYFTVPNQANATGPTSGVNTVVPATTQITVQARDAITQAVVPLHLRAARVRACGEVAMNSAAACGADRSSVLKVWFDAADNTALRPGTRYSAKFDVQARTWTGGAVNRVIPVSVNVDLLDP